MSFSTNSTVTLNAGETFRGGYNIQVTVITAAVISDAEGNVFGSYEAGTSYEGLMPNGVFTVTSGSIKIWNL